MWFNRFFCVAIFVCCSQLGIAQHSFTLESPRVVSSGELFKVVFSSTGKVEEFTQPTFSGLEIVSGPAAGTIQGTNIINGRRTDYYQVTYTYLLKANSAKEAKIGSASAKIDGKTYSSQPVSIEIVPEGDKSSGQDIASSTQQQGRGNSSKGAINADDIFLKINISKVKAVKGEPIIATLKLYSNLEIVGFEDIKFPVFNGFWSQEIETPQNLRFERERVGNKIYGAALLKKYILLPQQSGDLTIDAAEMIAQLRIKLSSEGSRGFFDDFFDEYQTVKKRISTKPIKIKVAALPAGAPASFGGGVGKFSMSINLSRDSVKSNEAASVIVELSGSGNLNLIEAPKLSLPKDFEVYDLKTANNFTNSSSGINGRKSFEFPFIPRSEGDFKIPPIEYSYYDIAAGKYVTLKTEELNFKVTKGESVAVGSLVGGLSKQEVANLGDDIRYIVVGRSALKEINSFYILSPLYFVVLLVIILFGAFVYYMLREHYKLKRDIRRTKSKKANKIAKKRLYQAQIYMKDNLVSPFYEELHKAMLGYVADKLGIPFAQLQKENIADELMAKGVAKETVDGVITLLDECELARYSQHSVDINMQDHYSKSINVISALEDSI